jgi:hypothetical protein
VKGRRRLFKNGHGWEKRRENEQVRVKGNLDGTCVRPIGLNESRARPPCARTRLVRLKGDLDETCARPTRAHHYGGSNRGVVRALYDGACII